MNLENEIKNNAIHTGLGVSKKPTNKISIKNAIMIAEKYAEDKCRQQKTLCAVESIKIFEMSSYRPSDLALIIERTDLATDNPLTTRKEK